MPRILRNGTCALLLLMGLNVNAGNACMGGGASSNVYHDLINNTSPCPNSPPRRNNSISAQKSLSIPKNFIDLQTKIIKKGLEQDPRKRLVHFLKSCDYFVKNGDEVIYYVAGDKSSGLAIYQKQYHRDQVGLKEGANYRNITLNQDNIRKEFENAQFSCEVISSLCGDKAVIKITQPLSYDVYYPKNLKSDIMISNTDVTMIQVKNPVRALHKKKIKIRLTLADFKRKFGVFMGTNYSATIACQLLILLHERLKNTTSMRQTSNLIDIIFFLNLIYLEKLQSIYEKVCYRASDAELINCPTLLIAKFKKVNKEARALRQIIEKHYMLNG